MELRHHSLQKWTIFGLLDPEFVSNIKIVCVFGNLGHEAIIVTKDDQIFSLGSNVANCLGLENLSSSLTPVKVESLCNKGIKGFAYGAGPHVLAYTCEGEVFSWGGNGFCQTGLGTSSQSNAIPTLIQNGLTGKRVVSVAAGSHHSLFLTSDGEVYSCGQNSQGQVGCGSTANQPIPRRVSTILGTCKIVSIACGQTSSYAINENGEIYSWGSNNCGQLGLGNTVNQYNPTKVNFPSSSVFITKVVCGSSHTLTLSDSGEIYAFGANSYGQIGAGHKSNITTPQRVCTELGRIVDIAATHYSHTSALATHTKIYMFGQCRGQSIISPVETPFTNLHDVFACFSSPAVTWAPIYLENHSVDANIIDCLKLAFDDPKTSDIQFLVEGKEIHAHKAILRIRSDHFKAMFQGKWEENQESVIKVDLGVRYNVFKAFLQYLYTDKIDLPSEDAVDLLKLANYYCETRLRGQCETLIKQSITIDNCARLYSSAIEYNAKELEDFCFQYMLHHLTLVVKSESFIELDGELIKNLIILLADQSAFKY